MTGLTQPSAAASLDSLSAAAWNLSNTLHNDARIWDDWADRCKRKMIDALVTHGVREDEAEHTATQLRAALAGTAKALRTASQDINFVNDVIGDIRDLAKVRDLKTGL